MTILWPEVVRNLRAQGDHWRRRLTRMELMAFGGRVDWASFEEARAYTEGLADAYKEALGIIASDTAQQGGVVDDPCVIELARKGLSVEVVANRCGVTVRDVAATLIRYVESFEEQP